MSPPRVQPRRATLALLLSGASLAAAPSPAPQETAPLTSFPLAQLRVESGAVEPLTRRPRAEPPTCCGDPSARRAPGCSEPPSSGALGRFEVTKPSMRALLPGTTGSAARLRFSYRGPSQETAPLASGEVRRQIGLKLRAQDTCNVLYVMWRLAPRSGIVVQLKSNPGQHTHAECGDHGYQTVESRQRRGPAPVGPSECHELAAFIDGDSLRVMADGLMAWEGALPPPALGLEGPVGVRSDNGDFEAELWAAKR